MGQIFTLTADITGPATQLFDDTINEFGRECKLVYPPRIVQRCNNCVFSEIGHKSSNVYLPGGPLPFPNGSICPVCHSEGGIAEEFSEVIKMIIHWYPSKFGNMKIDNIRFPKGALKASGFMSDVQKVISCSYMIPDYQIDAYRHYRFKLAGEPVSFNNIIVGRYFDCLWERIQ